MFSAKYGVIGLGTVGSFAFSELASQGEDVVGLEALGVANDLSAVGGDTRLFRRVYREGFQYHDFLERAFAGWNELNTEVPGSFVRCGALSVVDPSSDYAKSLEAYSEQYGLPLVRYEADELFTRFPQFVPDETSVGYFDLDGGFIRTDLVVRNAVDTAVANGGRCKHAAVTHVEPQLDGVLVECGDQQWRFERIIVCAGARTLLLLPQLRPVANSRLLLMTWFESIDPNLFSAGQMPVFIRESGDIHVYGAPTLDGLHVKASGILPNYAYEFTDLNYAAEVTAADLAASEVGISRILQGVHPTPVRTNVYPELYSRDGEFILDWVDEAKRIFVASAFSGKGFKMANALGAYAGAVVTDTAEIDPRFALIRFER